MVPTTHKTVFLPAVEPWLRSALITPEIVLASFPTTRSRKVASGEELLHTRIVIGRRTYTYQGPVEVRTKSKYKTVLAASLGELHERGTLSVALAVTLEEKPPRGTEVVDVDLSFTSNGSIAALSDELVEGVAEKLLVRFCHNLEKVASDNGLLKTGVTSAHQKKAVQAHGTNPATGAVPEAKTEAPSDVIPTAPSPARSKVPMNHQVVGDIRKVHTPLLPAHEKHSAKRKHHSSTFAILAALVGAGALTAIMLTGQDGPGRK